MADSENFGFVNVAKLNLSVDSLRAFRRYLRLAVDTVLGAQPEEVLVSRFCIEHSYTPERIARGGLVPVSDGSGDYLRRTPIHYWIDLSTHPLEICVLGSGKNPDLRAVRNGRITFANQTDLLRRTMREVRKKTFERDVLPYSPPTEYTGRGDINVELLQSVLDAPDREFPAVDDHEGPMIVTGEQLRGHERIGYTLQQITDRNGEHTLEIGLCKVFYPK